MSTRRTKKTPVRDLNKEQEVLESSVRTDGVGEDPAIKALLSDDFISAPDSEALQVALALQEIIRCKTSLLARID